MVIFNSYVKLPEGISSIKFYIQPRLFELQTACISIKHMVGLVGRKLGSCWKMRIVGFVYWDIVIICHPRERIIRLGTPTGHIHYVALRSTGFLAWPVLPAHVSPWRPCWNDRRKWVKRSPKCCQQQLTFKVSAEAEMSPNSEFVNAQTSWNPRVSEITCGHRAAIKRYRHCHMSGSFCRAWFFKQTWRAKRNDAPQQLWMPMFDHVYPKLALYFLLTRYTLGKKHLKQVAKPTKSPSYLAGQ